MAGKAFWDLATQPPDEAEADFKTLVSKYSKFPNVHYFYGTYLAARDPERCAPEFLQELRVTPDSVPARVQLALRYVLEGKLDQALKLTREAVALSPDSVGAQLALAKDAPNARRRRGRAVSPLSGGAPRSGKPGNPASDCERVSAPSAVSKTCGVRMQSTLALKAEQANWP